MARAKAGRRALLSADWEEMVHFPASLESALSQAGLAD